MTDQPSSLLALPIEIREVIYSLLFGSTSEIKIEAAPAREYEYSIAHNTDSTTWSADFESWATTKHPLSAQLLRVCRQIHDEAAPFLYSHRTFNLSPRESLKLMLHNIGPTHFEYIRHIIIGWETMEDLSRALNKDEYRIGTAGLKSMRLCTWRIRHMQGTSNSWRSVRGHERTMCQAAADIIEKHAQLRIVAETEFQRADRTPWRTPVNRKVKWRFITSESELQANEVAIDIKGDLQRLRATKDEASDGGFSLGMVDPF